MKLEKYEVWNRVLAVAAPRLKALRDYLESSYARALEALSDERRKGALISLSLAAALLVGFLVWTVIFLNVPDGRDISEATVPGATIAYTADGQELVRYHIENRTWVPLDSISRPVIDALIATEDHRFYRHNGVDVARVFGAIAGTAGGTRQGGSTLTMQLARNIYPDIRNDPILVRKVKEWLISMRIEDRYSKDEILEMYLNMVPFMYDAVGIEAAARTYFEKPASRLDVLEAATLVGMLKATVYYNPVRHPERAIARRNAVLYQMVRHGFLDEAEYRRLRDVPTTLRFRRLTRHENAAPHFAEYVRQWLDAWAEENGYNLYTEGLRVYTTLDTRLQEAARASVREVLDDLQAVVDVEWGSANPIVSSNVQTYRELRDSTEPFAYFWEANPHVLDEVLRATPDFRRLVAEGSSANAALRLLKEDSAFVDSVKTVFQTLEAGFVAMEPHTGYVRFWVGGRSFKDDEYDHVALAKRQPGSTFKPFVYAAALENGYAPYSMMLDAVRDYVNPYTGERWRPQNFGGASGQLMTLKQGLIHSKNTITAQLISTVGPQKVAEVARNMGIKSELREVLSLGLGTSEVSLLEMVSAYSAFANLGVAREPIFVTRIEDRHGNLIASFEPRGAQAIAPYTADAVLNMMRGVIDYGTGVRMRSLFGAKGDLAGKTGTTQNAADGWFMLLHPDLVMGAWVGFKSPLITFRSTYWGQGAHTALHVVGEFYRRATDEAAGLLDTRAHFLEGPEHHWRSRYVTDVDALNRHERRTNKLDEVLKRIRSRKKAN